MKNKKLDPLILSLIKADLVNTKLIVGLQQAGLGVENFYTDLAGSIFDLIGFLERDDDLFDHYYNLLGEFEEMDVYEFQERLNAITRKIYRRLLQEKEKRGS